MTVEPLTPRQLVRIAVAKEIAAKGKVATPAEVEAIVEMRMRERSGERR